MRSKFIFPALAGALLLFGGCRFELGGGSSSETESTLAGEIRHADNHPAASARVTLMPSAYLHDSTSQGFVPAEAVTDADGRFSFLFVQAGRYDLEARVAAGDSTLGSRRQIEVTGKPGTFRLEPMPLQACSSVTGRVTFPGGVPAAMVLVYGTKVAATLDPSGGFALNALSPGFRLLRIAPESPALGALELAFRPGRTLGALSLHPGKVLRVSDFEGHTVETAFAAVLAKGAWYASDDGRSDDPSTYRPSAIREDFVSAFTDSGSWSGSSLHVELLPGGNPSASYASVAFSIGTGRPGHDLTALDSVTFQARGRGRIRFEFQTRAIIDRYKDWRHFAKEVELPAEWARISIPIGQMVLPAGSPALRDGLAWATEGRQVVNVVFLAEDPADFWMDDLVFWGLSVRDL